MCTAINVTEGRHLFGRTLDLELSYGQQAVIISESFPLGFLYQPENKGHFKIMGTAVVFEGKPLFFDGINDKGLCAAGLNFGKNAVYHNFKEGSLNLASFEVIPFLLSSFKTVDEAEECLRKANITGESVSEELPATPLHWMISDKNRSITVESDIDGLSIYENPVGVMTNSPEFPYHLTRLADYMGLDSFPVENWLCPSAPIEPYARGLSAVGLPGDMSSSSRFIKTVFSKFHTAPAEQGREVSRFFHIIGTVNQPDGFARTEDGKKVRTVYTVCADPENMTCYYTTYNCRRIINVSALDHPTAEDKLIAIPLPENEDIKKL